MVFRFLRPSNFCTTFTFISFEIVLKREINSQNLYLIYLSNRRIITFSEVICLRQLLRDFISVPVICLQLYSTIKIYFLLDIIYLVKSRLMLVSEDRRLRQLVRDVIPFLVIKLHLEMINYNKCLTRCIYPEKSRLILVSEVKELKQWLAYFISASFML